MPSKNSTGATDASEPSARAERGNLLTRVVSALVMAPIVLLAVHFGGWAFTLLVFALALVASVEWVRLVEPEAPHLPALLGCLAVVIVLGLLLLAGAVPALATGLALTAVLYVAVKIWGGKHSRLVALTVPYIGLGAGALIWLRNVPDDGLWLLLFAMVGVWATDIGAYFAGRAIGGPKLAPRFSPKKTWSGLVGGMAAAALTGAAIAVAAGAAHPPLAAVAGAVLAVIAQAGDLFESAIKRRYGVKDSGTLIPGHGGLLDRIDGLLTAAPAFALFHAVQGNPAPWW